MLKIIETLIKYKKLFSTISLVVVFGLVYTFLYFKKQNDAVITIDKEESSVAVDVIHIDVSGAVINPGTYVLAPDSRIIDAVEASGGLRKEGSPIWIAKNLNLVQKLVDEQKIYIPFEWEIVLDENMQIIPLVFEDVSSREAYETTSSNSGDTKSNKIRVNSASLAELDALAGIGPAYAQKIIDNRPYTDLASLISNSGIPKSTLEKIAAQLVFD